MRPPTKRQTFWLLMAASAASMALAPGLIGPVRGMFDPVLAPLSSWLYESTQTMRIRAGQWAGGETDSPGDPARLAAELEAVRQENAMLRQVNRQLTTQFDEARLVREQVRLRGRLIPATVLARDAVGWREGFLIDIGRNVQLRPKQWAMAGVRAFADRGRDSGLDVDYWAAATPGLPDRPVGAVLVGRVELVGQVTARIKLLTDWDSEVLAEIYPADADQSIAVCTIRGHGPGQLRAVNISSPPARGGERASDRPLVNPGDRVVISPSAPNHPGTLYIGRVVEFDKDKAAAKVQPPDYSDLRRVYLFDPTDGSGGKEGS